MASGTIFLGEDGFTVKTCSVILIDEDTPTDTHNMRLKRLNTCGANIQDLSMTGFRLLPPQVEELINRIQSLAPPVVVLMDSLSTISPAGNLDKTGDAMRMMSQLNKIKTTGATLIVSHHLSLKKPSGYNDFDFTPSSMGNTMLVAQCDTALGIWRMAPEIPTRFAVSAKPRRSALGITKPFAVELLEGKNKDWAYLTLLEDIPDKPTRVDVDIFRVFSLYRSPVTVQSIMGKAQKDYSEMEIRESLHRMEKEGVLEKGIGSRNLFRYSIHPNIINQFALLSTYQEELLEAMGSKERNRIRTLEALERGDLKSLSEMKELGVSDD